MDTSQNLRNRVRRHPAVGVKRGNGRRSRSTYSSISNGSDTFLVLHDAPGSERFSDVTRSIRATVQRDNHFHWLGGVTSGNDDAFNAARDALLLVMCGDSYGENRFHNTQTQQDA